MKTTTFTIAILFLTGIFFQVNAWNTLVSGTNQTLNSVYFTDANTGYAVGTSGTILKTMNGGLNWNLQTTGTTDALFSVFFINTNIGYAVGGGATNSTILKTINGGINWTAQISPTTKWLKSVYFVDLNNGYAVGYNGTIIKTINGGATWSALTSSITSHLISVYFINNNVGFAVGFSGKLLKTVNAGTTWTQEVSGTAANLKSIFFVDNSTGFIGGSGVLLKTVDAGLSWSTLSNQSVNSLYFTDFNNGYAVSAFGDMFKTIDGGISWTAQAIGNDNTINAVFFTNALTGFAVGGSGTVLKTTIGGGYSDNGIISTSNIKARLFTGGTLFWDMISNANFEVPKGSGKMSLFAGALWIGGKDNSGQIHLAGDRYSFYGHDYFPGPVMDSVYYLQDQELWNRMWKVTRAEIEYHISHGATPGYVMPVNISEWPGNGDPAKGQMAEIAPYYDVNGDGLYSPQQGDYPLIKGDEALFFVFNDDMKPHTESSGSKLGLEIHAMAYAFDCPGDSAFWNTLFLSYEIINKSQNTYDSSFVGTFMDFDIGDAQDDYVGCDVQRGTFYGYNGDANDGDGQGITYGTYPPAQSVTFLGGPTMDADGSDFGTSGIADGCDESINGLGFNDGIIDNERLGMSSFLYFNNSGGQMGDPTLATEYYNYLTAHWKDGTHMTYGGTGHLSDSIYCKFMFPDVTDSCGWGTEGIPRPAWSEATENNPPADRRGVGAMGPFTMLPGSVHNVDLAFVFGRDFTNPSPWAGVINMQQRIDSVRKAFITQKTPCGTFSIGVKENKIMSEEINIFPNPAQNYFDVKCNNINDRKTIKIYTIEGTLIKEESFIGNLARINTEIISNGLYVVEIKSNNNVQYKKVIVAK